MALDPKLTRVVNQTRVGQSVDIIKADGTRDSIYLGPGGKVNIGEGDKVCDRWKALNRSVVNIIEPKVEEAVKAQEPLIEEPKPEATEESAEASSEAKE